MAIHKYAAYIKALIDGEEVEYAYTDNYYWSSVWSLGLFDDKIGQYKFRIKPPEPIYEYMPIIYPVTCWTPWSRTRDSKEFDINCFGYLRREIDKPETLVCISYYKELS